MMKKLRAVRRPAASGKGDSLVIFLHGYGADGDDLIGLAHHLARHLPNSSFVSPHAPEQCKINPGGYQWFPIPGMDGSSEFQTQASLATSLRSLRGFIAEEMKLAKVKSNRTILFGFSQGTMIGLSIGLAWPESFAGIVGCSGSLLPTKQASHKIRRPPVLLIHGDQDPVIPWSAMVSAERELKVQGITVTSYLSRGIGHGIAPDGLRMALGFIRKCLSA